MVLRQSNPSILRDCMRIRVLLPGDNEPKTHQDTERLKDAFRQLAEYFHREGKFLSDLRTSSAACAEVWCAAGIEEAVVTMITSVLVDASPVIEVQAVRLATPSDGLEPVGDQTDPLATDASIVLPRNQAMVGSGKWPVVGERAPRQSDEPWTITISGLVESERTWGLDEFMTQHELREQSVNIHCVTRWSKIATRFRGIPLSDVLAPCGVLANAQYVRFVARSDRNHSTSLPLNDAIDLQAMIAFSCEGEPLTEEHGGPVRMIVPGRYFYKSLKWLEKIELLEVDELGYWESETGYHNRADPWLEERYAVPNLDRREVMSLFRTKDFSRRELRSLEASNLQLSGLNASGAMLRDARFANANLQDACFDGANLSNAHFQRADLRRATFRPCEDLAADLEGADFRGADLRGAVFESASCFGASFCDESNPDHFETSAIIDSTTRIDEETIRTLDATAPQKEFVVRAIRR